MSKARLMQGNEAVAEGALLAGVRFFGGYPITPSTEIAEGMAKMLPQVGGTFIQMEDEIASMGVVLGASLAGRKVLTASSFLHFTFSLIRIFLCIYPIRKLILIIFRYILTNIQKLFLLFK